MFGLRPLQLPNYLHVVVWIVTMIGSKFQTLVLKVFKCVYYTVLKLKSIQIDSKSGREEKSCQYNYKREGDAAVLQLEVANLCAALHA